MMTKGKLKFCELFVHLDGPRIQFPDRPYLTSIYGSRKRKMILRTSRQVEKSTYLCNSLLYEAATRPGTKILFVCPRQDQALTFVRSRLVPMLEQSPYLSRVLLGKSKKKLPIKNMRFANESQLFVRAAYLTADAARGLSADVLMIDEFQDVAPGALPVLLETLSHSTYARTLLTGTPKLSENPIEGIFAQSTANEWTMTCEECGADVIPDERCLGNAGIACPQCRRPLDARHGRWVPRQPDAQWGDGYWLNHLMVPWKKNKYDEILECQRVYDFAQFKNEVLGLPVSLGEHIVTREELEACCTEKPMAKSIDDIPAKFHNRIFAGVDWGGGGPARTVVVVGFTRPEGVFEICHFARLRSDEDPERVRKLVAEVCAKFRVRAVGADGGGFGTVYNRLLLGEVQYQCPLYAILYSASDTRPFQEGVLWKWSVNRSATIGYLFSCISKKKIQFPRIQDCGGFLDEFACEMVEYDDIRRCVKYTHPTTKPDDALHAANYALQIASRAYSVSTDAY